MEQRIGEGFNQIDKSEFGKIYYEINIRLRRKLSYLTPSKLYFRKNLSIAVVV